MKNQYKAKKILEKIEENENTYLVNNDCKFTDEINAKIANTDWNKIKLENVISNTISNSLEDKEMRSEYNNNMTWYSIYSKSLNEYKDITNKIPSDTRLYFVKKVINKIMKVSMRYQEIFNNSVCGLINSMANKINDNERNIFQATNKINDLYNKFLEIENYTKEKSEKKDKIELESILKKVEELSEVNRNQEKWLKSIEEKQNNQEKWLDIESNRIKGNEKWLESTNKRVDACNEMLSANPKLGYQSYSQSGEDTIIMNVLGNLKQHISRVTYLDIGCNHYKNYNNTFRFYQKGLNGVLVEANPKMIDEIRKYRPRDIVLNCGVGVESGDIMNFYITNGGGLSSFNKTFIDETLSNNKDAYIENIVPVNILSINEIIEENFEEAPVVVSIDIEGDEYGVLESLNYDKYRPLIFIVETIEYRTHITLGIKRNEIEELMERKGYKEYAFTGINSIFIDTKQVSVEF